MSYSTGMEAFKAGNYQIAADAFMEVVNEDENNHKAWNALGVVYTKTGQYEHADTCYENALTLAPGTAAYERNREKNKEKWQPEDVLSVDDDKPEPQKSIPQQESPNEGDRFSNKLAILLAVLGFLFGVIISVFVMLVGGIGGVLGVSGSESLIGRAWIVMFLCLIGVIASVVRHKRYGSIILILVGICIIILISAGGIIPGALFIVAGYLIFKETRFDFSYYTYFKDDTVKKILFTLIILGCLFVTVSGISFTGNNDSEPVEEVTTPVQSQVTAPVTSVVPVSVVSGPDFSSVTHATVMAVAKSWDADAENDGVIIFPNLLDAKDETVKWKNGNIPVDVELWTTGFDKSFKQVQETKVYSGSGTITSWEDGNFLMGPGIQIPYESLSGVGDKSTGRTRVNIHLTDGRTMEAIYDFTPLKP